MVDRVTFYCEVESSGTLPQDASLALDHFGVADVAVAVIGAFEAAPTGSAKVWQVRGISPRRSAGGSPGSCCGSGESPWRSWSDGKRHDDRGKPMVGVAVLALDRTRP